MCNRIRQLEESRGREWAGGGLGWWYGQLEKTWESANWEEDTFQCVEEQCGDGKMKGKPTRELVFTTLAGNINMFNELYTSKGMKRETFRNIHQFNVGTAMKRT
jgi:hypothetical protein